MTQKGTGELEEGKDIKAQHSVGISELSKQPLSVYW